MGHVHSLSTGVSHSVVSDVPVCGPVPPVTFVFHGTVYPSLPVVVAEVELVSTDVVSFSVEAFVVKVTLLLASGEKSVTECFVDMVLVPPLEKFEYGHLSK